jgi:O-antigen/teichoic acid export membrane protein
MAQLSDKPDDMAEPPAPAVDVLDSRRAGGLLLRGSALRLAGYAAGVALSVASAAVMTRYLGVSRFGQYTTVMSLVAVVAAVTDVGMSNIGTREYAIRCGADRDMMMRDLLGLRVVLTLIGVGLATGFAFMAGYDLALLLGTVAASLGTVALVFQHTLSIPLTTDLRLGTLSTLELVRQALLVAGLVALAAMGSGVFALLSVTLLVNLVLIAPTAALVRGRISWRLSLRPSRWPPLLQATVVFALATAVGTVYVYTAQVLTSLVTSHHQTGLFAVSFRVFIVSASVPGLLVGASLPLLSRAARDDEDRLAYALQRIFETSLIGGVGSAIMLSSASGWIVSVIAGPGYRAAAPVLAIQAYAMIASFVLAGWSFGLLSLHLHRALLAANFVTLVVSVSLTLALAASHGARGAAIATVGGESTLALACLIALVRGRPRYRPHPGVVAKVALAAAPAVLASMVLSVSALERTAVAAMVYVAVIAVTRALPRELVELMPTRVRRK